MKLTIIDSTESEHDLEKVIFDFAADIYRIIHRLKRIEDEIGITYQNAEAEAIKDAEVDNGSD